MIEQEQADPKLKDAVLSRMRARPRSVWTPVDFVDLAGRDAVDKLLQRLTKAGTIRRVERGLYDVPRSNALTGKPTVADYREVIEAVARREQARIVIDGMTAANELRLTTAIPAKVEVLIDTRLRPIKLGNQEIRFQHAAPSKLYWAGRPAMPIVQALQWMRDVMRNPDDRSQVMDRISAHIASAPNPAELRADLKAGVPAMPIWMQDLVQPLIGR